MPSGPGETPSRRRLFVCQPTSPDDEEECAKRILSNLMRRAYRRPVDDEDLKTPMEFYRAGRAEGDFDAGIEMALSSVLVNPQFLFRIERDPPDVAFRDRLSNRRRGAGVAPVVLPVEQHPGRRAARSGRERRAEPAGSARTTSAANAGRQAFAVARQATSRSSGSIFAIWNRSIRTCVCFPDFDDNLRQAMRQETELFFESIVREDRSVLDLIKADYTYLNERLAKHYGIPHVYGSHFRRVSLDEDSRRGGLLRHGKHPRGDVVRDPHFAGDSRPMGAQESGRRPAPAAARQCAGARRQYRFEHAFRARAAQAASRESKPAQVATR